MTERIGLIAQLDIGQFTRNYNTYISSVQRMNAETLKTVTGTNAAFSTLGSGLAAGATAVGTIATGFKNAGVAALNFGSYLNNTLYTSIKRIGLIAGIATIAMIKMGKDPVSAAAEVEAQLSRVQAIIGLTKDQAVFLKEAVMELGIDPKLVVTTKEAADIMEMLAKNGIFAGISLKEMEEIALDAGRAIVYLANSTGADFSQATDIATDVMLMFNKEAKDMEQVVAGIIGVTTNSKFTIHDYELALRNGGAAAASFGVALEDFNTIIALTAEETGRGRRAGTGFANVMYRLVPISDKAAATMKELGIITADGTNRFFDAEGNMQDFTKVVALLNETFIQTKTVMQEVSYLTPTQQQLLADLKVEYANAEKVIAEYTTGVKSLTASEEVRNKKISESQAIIEAITPKMQELSSIESDWVETVIEMSDAREIEALRTMFGRDALASVIGLMKEGAPIVEQFANRGEAVAQVIEMIGVSQEEANKMLDEGVTYFDLMRIRLEQIDPEEMAKIRMDNLKGSIEILSSIIETLWIKIGTRLIPIMTELVRKITDWLTNNKELQAWLEGVAAAVGTFIESLSRGKGLFDSVNDAFETLYNVTVGLLEENVLSVLAGDMSEFAERGEDVARAMISARGNSEEWGTLQRAIVNVKTKITEMHDSLISAKTRFDEFITPIKDFYTAHAPQINDALRLIAKFIGALMIGSAVASVLALIFSPIGIIIGLVAAMGYAWNNNLGGIQDKIYSLRDTVLEFLDEIGVLKSFELGGFAQVWEDLPQAFENVRVMVEASISGFLDGIKEKIENFDLGQSIYKLFSVFAEMKGLTPREALLAFDQLKEKLRPISALFKAVADVVLPSLKKSWEDITTSLRENFLPVWETLKRAFEDIGPFLELLAVIFGTIFAVVLGIVTSLITAVIGGIDTFIEASAVIIQGVINIFSGLTVSLGGIWDIIAGIFTLNGERIGEGFKNFFVGIGRIIEGLLQTIAGFIYSLFGTIIDVVWGFIQNIWKFFVILYDELVGHSIIPDMVNAIIEWFNTLVARVTEFIISLVTSVLRWVGDLKLRFQQYIYDLVTAVLTRFGIFILDMVAKATELKDKVIEKVHELWKEFIEAVSKKVLEIITQFTTFIKDILQLFTDMKDDFFDAGAGIMDGIIDGIMNKLAAAVATILRVGADLWEAWTNFWQQKSPSKLMMNSAKQIMEGADIGFESSVPTVSQTLENAATTMFSSFLDRTNDILPFGGNRNPVQNINNTSTKTVTLNNNFAGNPQITDANQLELLLAGY